MNNQSENKEGKRSALLSYLKHSLEINSNPALTDSDKEYLIELLSHPVEEKEGLDEVVEKIYKCVYDYFFDHDIELDGVKSEIKSILSALPAFPDIKEKLQEIRRNAGHFANPVEYYEQQLDTLIKSI